MRLFGYARVSTSQQSLDIQINALKDALGNGAIRCNKVWPSCSCTGARRSGIVILNRFSKKMNRISKSIDSSANRNK